MAAVSRPRPVAGLLDALKAVLAHEQAERNQKIVALEIEIGALNREAQALRAELTAESKVNPQARFRASLSRPAQTGKVVLPRTHTVDE